MMWVKAAFEATRVMALDKEVMCWMQEELTEDGNYKVNKKMKVTKKVFPKDFSLV
jgi:hypothetical protein